MFLLIFAVALVLVGAWLRSTRDEVLRVCGVWLLAFALIFGVIAFAVGCSESPTAPTSVVRFAWAAPPSGGCTPTLPIPEQIGMPIGGVKPLWIWSKDNKVFTYEMKREYGFYFVCSWKVQ